MKPGPLYAQFEFAVDLADELRDNWCSIMEALDCCGLMLAEDPERTVKTAMDARIASMNARTRDRAED